MGTTSEAGTAPAGEEFGYHELERTALSFVLEDETWPVFLAWAWRGHGLKRAHDWLKAGPDVDTYRRLWLAHSEYPEMRALAEVAGDV